MRLTHQFAGAPGKRPVRFVQVWPPSRVRCTRPSSEPTINVYGSKWLSSMHVNVQCGTLPLSLSGSAVVRSSEISVQLSPRSSDLKKRSPPKYSVRGLWRESRIGEFQLKRYGFSPSGARGLIICMPPVARSRRYRLPNCHSA